MKFGEVLSKYEPFMGEECVINIYENHELIWGGYKSFLSDDLLFGSLKDKTVLYFTVYPSTFSIVHLSITLMIDY